MKKFLQFIHDHATALSALGTGVFVHLMNDATFTTILTGTGIGSIALRLLISLLIPQYANAPKVESQKYVSFPKD